MKIINHIVNYTVDELKSLSKKHEVYRDYPQNPNHAYIDIRDFLNSGVLKNTKIEVSNLGNIRINNEIVEPYEKEKGYYFVKIFDTIEYPVYRLVAETWLEFEGDTIGWQVHHIVDDGLINTPENLIWVKENIHMSLHH